jgi:hypothetical protein
MEEPLINAVKIIDKTYDYTYSDAAGNPTSGRGKMVDPDRNGFAVFENNGRLVLVPKDRIVVIEEIDEA